MADWYVSSAAYATYTAFQTSHAYSIGALIVPTAPALQAKYVFRCTTAGTSTTEPAWTTVSNATSTSGTAVFTNVTGQSTYFWTAAAGDIPTITNLFASPLAAGDRVFLSSDHSETQTASTIYGSGSIGTTAYGLLQWLSVNRAGSTPPVAADLAAGASVACSSVLTIQNVVESYHYGITYSVTGTGDLALSNNSVKAIALDNCQLWLNTTSSAVGISCGTSINAGQLSLLLNNTTLKFGHVSQSVKIIVSSSFMEMIWQNTANAIAGATFPTNLFIPAGNSPGMFICRGVDLSNISGALVLWSTGNSKYLFGSCKINSGVTRYGTTAITSSNELVELVNCYDGTHFISESHTAAGDVTTEFTITLPGGATDNVGTFSHKMVSNANANKFVTPLAGFWLDVGNTSTGSSKTATVEIISLTTLNNDEIALYLAYEGTAGSSVVSFTDSFAGPITTPSAVTTSTATWNASPTYTSTGGFASSVTTFMNAGNVAANSIYLTKVTLTNAATVSAVWLNVSAGSAANSRVLIYDSSHSALLAEGSIAALSAGLFRFPLTTNWSASAGTYYVGYVSDGSLNLYVDPLQTGSSWIVSGGQSVASPANPLVGGSSQNSALQIALEFANAGQSFGWGTDYSANVTLSASNTVATFSGSVLSGARSVATQSPLSGKFYCEVLVGGTVDSTCLIGVQAMSVPPNGATADFFMSTYSEAGSFGGTGVTNSGTPSSWTSGDVIGIAYDTATNTIWYNKNNGSWQGGTSPNPTLGTGGIPFSATISIWPVSVVAMRGASSAAAVYTLQDRSTTQTYAPPAGFTAWSSTPQKQKLQVTFTPQHAGRVRGQVRLGKANATVYVNPQITIT